MYCNDGMTDARDSKTLLKFWRDEEHANLDSNEETLLEIETISRLKSARIGKSTMWSRIKLNDGACEAADLEKKKPPPIRVARTLEIVGRRKATLHEEPIH